MNESTKNDTPRVAALSKKVQNQNWGFRDMQVLALQLERELSQWKECAEETGRWIQGLVISNIGFMQDKKRQELLYRINQLKQGEGK